MHRMFSLPGAAFRVAPVAFWALFFLLASQAVAATPCPARETGERVRVVHVYDGDTVKLTDGRRVRLIGINTPELNPDRRVIEPFASEAKSLLQSLIDRNNRTLLLQYDNERTDHYGRLLAHAFLESGENVAVRLLQAGLATTLVVPPNTWAHGCYQSQEDQARIERRGIWDHPAYQSRDCHTLSHPRRGFHLVHCRVQRVRSHGQTTWLELAGPLKVHIARQDLVNFPAGYLERLAGQTVELRGWIRPRDGKLLMRIRHPAALVTIRGDGR